MATHYVEGDGPLVFSCYEKLQAVVEACQAPHFPNVREAQQTELSNNFTQFIREA